MKGFKHYITTSINYLPGLVILAFGMLALHSTTETLKRYEAYKTTYRLLGSNTKEFQDYFFNLEIAFQKFGINDTADNLEHLEYTFNVLNTHYEHMLLSYSAKPRNIDIGKYEKNLLNMRQNFLNIAYSISDLKFEYADSQPEQKRVKRIAVRKNIDSLFADMIQLEGDFFKRMDELLHSSEENALNWTLYWAVVAISLSGFLLVILNAYKLQQLKMAANDRREHLAQLKKRQAAMESSRDGIAFIDRDGLITYMNYAYCAMHEIPFTSRLDYIGKNWRSIYKHDEVEKIKMETVPILTREGYWRGRMTRISSQGKEMFMELSVTKLADGGFISTTIDITEEHLARLEKQMLEQQFFQAQKMEAIGRLAGGIAHDFNNILAAINGYAEFLRDDLDPDTQVHKFAYNILLAARQARDLIDKMLAFSRRNDSAREPLDLLIPLQESLAMLEASLPRTIEVVENIAVREAIINGNTTQISQMIMNLCVNAQDAMENEHGKLMINVKSICAENIDFPEIMSTQLPLIEEQPKIKIEDKDPGHTRLIMGEVASGYNYICLSIRDTGCGMSRSVMEHIFEPFFTTKPVDKGTGLGLSTVHGVVISHQGMMVIDSIIGKGTVFQLFFPSVSGRATVNDILSESKEIYTYSIESQKRILVVDDQKNLQNMMQHMLERLGYTVDVCTNGLEALDLIRENPKVFDLIITDQNMPRMTGLELAQQVFLDFPDLPFILFSGYSQKEIQNIIAHHPAIKAVLRKPVSKEMLAQNVAFVLQSVQRDKA